MIKVRSHHDRSHVRLSWCERTTCLPQRRNTNISNYLLIKQVMSKFNYKEQHAVIVKVSSEDEQKKVFEKLKGMGFNDLKIVSV
jgi:hypothetical protein